MQAVSADFLAAIRSSHQVDIRVEAWRGDTRVGGTLAVLGGQVSNAAGATSPPRRTLSLELAPEKGLWDALAPVGTTLKVWRGVRYVDGTVERVPLGVFDVDEQSMSYAPDGTLSITAPDVWVRVQRARFEKPRTTGTNGIAEAVELAREAIGLGVGDVVTDTTAISKAVWERDREEAIRELSWSYGVWIHTDTAGRVVARDVPYLSGTPVWTVDASASGVLLDANRDRSRQRTYNVIVVNFTRMNSSAKVAPLIIADDDPTSPTYAGGPFGRVPFFMTRSLILSRAFGNRPAYAMLRRLKGLAADMELTSVVNPALEPGDVIQVVLPARAGDARRVERHLIDSVTVPLTADGTQQLVTRSSRPEGDVPQEE